MGTIILQDLVKAIDSFGVATERARPGQKAAIITKPVAAVYMKSADMAAQTITVVVTILSPMDKGAAECEDTALDIADLMHANLGADSCMVGTCQCDERAGVFFIDITGTISTVLVEE